MCRGLAAGGVPSLQHLSWWQLCSAYEGQIEAWVMSSCCALSGLCLGLPARRQGCVKSVAAAVLWQPQL